MVGDNKTVIDFSEHAELKLGKEGAKGKVPMVNQVVVVNGEGQIQVLDPLADKKMMEYDQTIVKMERSAIDKAIEQNAKINPIANPGDMGAMPGNEGGPVKLLPSTRKVKQNSSGGLNLQYGPPSSSSSSSGSPAQPRPPAGGSMR